ncbi:hypothetical protein C8Q80DRAFT_754244 [Daedaleopsis nitida]|nr:hypothetical protein C8Q80DRAFT_754244 [Daedaleopsis nitida]
MFLSRELFYTAYKTDSSVDRSYQLCQRESYTPPRSPERTRTVNMSNDSPSCHDDVAAPSYSVGRNTCWKAIESLTKVCSSRFIDFKF